MISDAMNSDWPKTLLDSDASLQQAIRNLHESGMQISLVVSADGSLLGTITDGDIRRGLLRGLGMQESIDPIIHRDAMVVTPQMNHEMVLHLMQANAVNALPVVDESRHVVGLYLLKELLSPKQRSNLMVIMAGGKGTRLRPHTENCPKSMLPVGGKPMLEHIVERARSEGFQHFVFAIHYLGHMIENYFGDGSRWKVKIDYLREKSPLGTAGAVGLLNPRPVAPLLVTNGDVMTDVQYGELIDFHCRHGATATMAVRLHEWHHPFGVVRTKGVDIIGFEEKPVARSHINAGIYVLDPGALDVLDAGEHCDMPVLFNRIQDKLLRTIVYPMHEPWLDVGHVDDLKKAHSKYSNISPE